jgi:hypothetical protein
MRASHTNPARRRHKREEAPVNHLRAISLLLVLPLLLSCSPTIAGAERGWTLRLHGVAIHSSAEHTTGVPGHGTFHGETGSGFGVAVGAEFRFNRVVGLEPSLLFSWIDADFQLRDGDVTYTDADKMSMNSLGLALNLHATPDSRVDLYFAIGLDFVDFMDMDATFEETRLDRRLTTGSDVSPGFAVGLDVPVGEKGWSFSAALKFMKAESRETDNPFWRSPIVVDVDPLLIKLGAAYRF